MRKEKEEKQKWKLLSVCALKAGIKTWTFHFVVANDETYTLVVWRRINGEMTSVGYETLPIDEEEGVRYWRRRTLQQQLFGKSVKDDMKFHVSFLDVLCGKRRPTQADWKG